MYILFLLLAAFFLISIFSTNWPVKMYHHSLLKNLAIALGTVPERYGLLFSNVYSEINTVYKRRQLKIRFVEASIDSLKPNSGLEIRMRITSETIMEFYHLKRNKREWGEFKRFQTGDKLLDSQWFILTNDLVKANDFWGMNNLKSLIANPHLEQLLINQDEAIVQLKSYRSYQKIIEFIEQMVQVIPD